MKNVEEKKIKTIALKNVTYFIVYQTNAVFLLFTFQSDGIKMQFKQKSKKHVFIKCVLSNKSLKRQEIGSTS